MLQVVNLLSQNLLALALALPLLVDVVLDLRDHGLEPDQILLLRDHHELILDLELLLRDVFFDGGQLLLQPVPGLPAALDLDRLLQALDG